MNRNGRRARVCECVKKKEEEGSGPMWCVRAEIEKSVRAETTKYGDHCAATVGLLRIGASPASASLQCLLSVELLPACPRLPFVLMCVIGEGQED